MSDYILPEAFNVSWTRLSARCHRLFAQTGKEQTPAANNSEKLTTQTQHGSIYKGLTWRFRGHIRVPKISLHTHWL